MTVARAPQNAPFEIGGESVEPGTTRQLDLAIARLPTYTRINVPIVVKHGRAPGPSVWISAAVHGDELNGIQIIQQVLERLKKVKIAGTVIAVPVVNVFGFIHQSRAFPDGRDLNRMFPGSAKGSLAARVAKLFMDEVVSKCAFGLDLHTGSGHRANLPQIRGNLDDETTLELAMSFGAPVTLHAKLRDGSLRDAASRLGIPVLLYEAGESQRFDRDSIDIGVAGVLRALDHLGVTPNMGPPADRVTCLARESKWMRARRGGLLRLTCELGETVQKGAVLGSVGDPFSDRVVKVKAPNAGVVIGQTHNPVVYQGDALVHIAT